MQVVPSLDLARSHAFEDPRIINTHSQRHVKDTWVYLSLEIDYSDVAEPNLQSQTFRFMTNTIQGERKATAPNGTEVYGLYCYLY